MQPQAERRTTEPFSIVVSMGVSGAGKTAVGRALAARLGWTFLEGDQFHPAANVAKMAGGRPLEDADRAPWLAAIAAAIDERLARGEPAVVACSALKKSYRRVIIGERRGVRLVYLRGSRARLAERLAGRRGHFMPASLLESQLATLEEPGPEERPIVVAIDPPIEGIVDQIVAALRAG